MLSGCAASAQEENMPDEIADGYLYFPTEVSGTSGHDAQVRGILALVDNCWTLQVEPADDPMFLAVPKGSVTIRTSTGVLALKMPNALVLEEGSTLDDSGGYNSSRPEDSPDLAALVKACPNVPVSPYEENTWEIAMPSWRQ